MKKSVRIADRATNPMPPLFGTLRSRVMPNVRSHMDRCQAPRNLSATAERGEGPTANSPADANHREAPDGPSAVMRGCQAVEEVAFELALRARTMREPIRGAAGL